MKHTINLDQVIRRQDGQRSLVAGEEVLVTIDSATGKATEKTLLVRFGGNYQDYLIANSRNPTRSGSGKLPTYYVRDARQARTLALDISVADCTCPPSNEVKAAEALHGEQCPSDIFASLFWRWVREFIPHGGEGDFIDNYDAAREHLESHLASRAFAQTGLELRPKVALSAEPTVPREIGVGPVEIGVRLQNYREQEQRLTVEAGMVLDPQHYVRAYTFQERQESPEELLKRHLKDYFFDHVTYEQFTGQLQQPAFKQPLLHAFSAALLQVGRRISFVSLSTSDGGTTKPPPEFVAVTYHHTHTIPGRSQPVLVQNTVQLYCENSVAFHASGVGVGDLEAWVKRKLNVILKRHLIGKSYVDLLLRFGLLEQSIKLELSASALQIGYKVDHLVSIPNLKEMDELTKPFIDEFDDTFETMLDHYEVQIKFNLKLCIPNLQTVEDYLNRGADVRQAIKMVTLRETRQCLRNIHPERFYRFFNHPNDEAEQEHERAAVKDLLGERLVKTLKAEFGAQIFDLTTRVGRTDLTERYEQLCFVISKFTVSIDPPDPQGTESLVLTGNFEVRGVHSDSEGWRRFSAMRLDLDGLQEQLEKHLRAELKTYYQSSFMFQNRVGRRQVFALVENYASVYMRREFGLIIHLTNLDRNTTQAEENQRKMLVDIENQKLKAALDQGQLIVNNLKELRRRRTNLLSVSPVDKEALREIDENIQLLQEELEAVTASRFGTHQLAATMEEQRPDTVPHADEAAHAAVQYELGPEPKTRLTD
jgi:hypothetical protein